MFSTVDGDMIKSVRLSQGENGTSYLVYRPLENRRPIAQWFLPDRGAPCLYVCLLVLSGFEAERERKGQRGRARDGRLRYVDVRMLPRMTR